MSKTLDKIIYARAAMLIESGWTKNTLARNAKDKAVHVFAKSAVKFCASGALIRAAHDVLDNVHLEVRFLEKVMDEMPRFVSMNVRGHKKAVLRIFKARAGHV